MSVSPIDALLQIAVPARPVEPPPRSDPAHSFAPALERAYGAEQSRNPPARIEERDETAQEPPREPTASRDSRQEQADETDAAVPGEEQPEPGQEPEADAVEISEEAAAATSTEQATAVSETAVKAALEGAALDAEKIGGATDASADSNTPEQAADDGKPKPQDNASALAKELAVARQASSDAASEKRDLKKKGSETTDVKPAKPTSNVDPKTKPDKGEQEIQTAPVQLESTGETETVANAEPAATEEDQTRAGDSMVPRSKRDEAAEPSRMSPTRAADVAPVATESTQLPLEMVNNIEQAASEDAPRRTEATGSAPVSSARAAGVLERMAARSFRSEQGGQSDSGPQIDRPRFVQRVEGAIRAAQQRDGRVQVRLSPPELGNLRIELAVQNGVLTARLEAETPAARNTLLDNLPALRERLAQQEIRIEKFDVDIRRDAGGNAGSGGPHDRNADQPNWGRQEGRGKPTAPRASLTTAPSPRSLAPNSVTDASLDVRI